MHLGDFEKQWTKPIAFVGAWLVVSLIVIWVARSICRKKELERRARAEMSVDCEKGVLEKGEATEVVRVQ